MNRRPTKPKPNRCWHKNRESRLDIVTRPRTNKRDAFTAFLPANGTDKRPTRLKSPTRSYIKRGLAFLSRPKFSPNLRETLGSLFSQGPPMNPTARQLAIIKFVCTYYVVTRAMIQRAILPE